MNHLSKEDMLSKMAELLETMINWSLKTMLGAVLGLQAVRGLVAPAMDAIKRTAWAELPERFRLWEMP